MDPTYSFLGFSLTAGSWAEWFSGAGSFGAVATSLLGYWIVRRQRIGDQNDRDKRAAESVGWKALEVYNETAEIAKYLKARLERAPRTEYQTMKFMRVQPLGVPPKSVPEIAPDEVSILLRAKAARFLMSLSECIKRYESIRFAMQEYKARHEAFYELMPTPVEGDGEFFKHILDKEQRDRVMPYAQMLDKLLANTVDLVAESMGKAQEMLDLYGPAMEKHFGKWGLAFEGDAVAVDLSEVRADSELSKA